MAYAYDFLMPIGSEVTAARSGTASCVWVESPDGAPEMPGNHVTITHEDGTVTIYGHLTQGGSLVDVGNRKEQGQAFALSGNTGASEEPHLHSPVSPSIDRMNDESLPVTFRNTTANPRGLERGAEYLALVYLESRSEQP